VTYWIRSDASRLTENIHGVVKVILEGWANSQSNIAEALQMGILASRFKALLCRFSDNSCMKPAEYSFVFSPKAREMSPMSADSDRTKLAVLMRLEGWE
jgi:hypothetical protein